MGGKKYLLIPGNNSLSHVAKCLAVRQALIGRGHEARIAVSKKHAPFLEQMAVDHFVLPDIQENDDSGFPSVEWFRRPRHIIDCVSDEVNLLKAYKPNRVLGVFRFTLKAAAWIAHVPYDSLICGCMIPEFGEVLGFAHGEPGRENQKIILDGFFQYAGMRADAAFAALGYSVKSGDVRHMLKGEHTFLWDFPEFAPLSQRNTITHVGPLSWNRWSYNRVELDGLVNSDAPLAIVSFGTCTVCLSSARRIVRVLIDLGYRVLLAAGGQKQFLDFMPADPRLIIHLFSPLHEILPHASLLVTHGGQLTVFEALQNRVPVMVMPFQPEQAHNGVCLERIGCGARLVPPQAFQGNSSVYVDALERMNDEEIIMKIKSLVQRPTLKARLAEARDIIAGYGGVESLVDSLEEF